MKNILFVDDETNILQGLARMLRGMRNEWDMTFLDDPRQAETLLGQTKFDAIVVDMRMPQMDGAELLAKARECSPGTARIVLSGYAEREAALRAVGLAHQFLSKPCDANTLRATVARICSLRELMDATGLADLVGGLGRLPSLPRLYAAVNEELQQEEVVLKRVAAIVGDDVAMTAKILQLVNSAFFGLGRRIARIEDAVTYLGVDIIRSLAISHSAFTAFDTSDREFFDRLWRHSSLTGLLAHRIAKGESSDPIVHGEALQAGMLHDIGQLVLASAMPVPYRRAREGASVPGTSLPLTEREAFGADHGHVGAYLMGLWGLSDRIVEALAYHDEPRSCPNRSFAPLTAVHVASVLTEAACETPYVETEIDEEYLAACGCLERLPQWREQAEEIVNSREASNGQT
jgi:HD-like signal output (HDOD) protein/CheY-like chemotaxis protein